MCVSAFERESESDMSTGCILIGLDCTQKAECKCVCPGWLRLHLTKAITGLSEQREREMEGLMDGEKQENRAKERLTKG